MSEFFKAIPISKTKAFRKSSAEFQKIFQKCLQIFFHGWMILRRILSEILPGMLRRFVLVFFSKIFYSDYLLYTFLLEFLHKFNQNILNKLLQGLFPWVSSKISPVIIANFLQSFTFSFFRKSVRDSYRYIIQKICLQFLYNFSRDSFGNFYRKPT